MQFFHIKKMHAFLFSFFFLIILNDFFSWQKSSCFIKWSHSPLCPPPNLQLFLLKIHSHYPPSPSVIIDYHCVFRRCILSSRSPMWWRPTSRCASTTGARRRRRCARGTATLWCLTNASVSARSSQGSSRQSLSIWESDTYLKIAWRIQLHYN